MYKMKQTGCYQHNGITYAEQFPERWARYHYPGTGPIDCSGCYESGFWNSAFVCYCIKCANIYEYERGGGLYRSIHFGEYGTYQPFVKAARNTYLRDVLLDEIGEKEVFDSVKYHGLKEKWTGLETLNSATLQYHSIPMDISNNKKLPNR